MDLVIDASVARAAGDKAANSPTSRLNRECLQAVLDHGHILILSPEIIAEWNAHQSNFARRWRLSMVARRRVRWIESQFNAQLRARLRATTATPEQWDALEKDCLLVEAALAAHRIIISLDEIARGLLRVSSIRVGEIRGIIWANPSDPEELVVEWIVAGCEGENQRTFESAE